MRQAAIRTGKGVNKAHGNWRPTEDIQDALESKFPHLEFPYLSTDHTHGVHSSVHCYCPEHQTFTRISLSNALYDITQHACSICAGIAGMKTRKANGFSTKQYIGKPGVQSGIFRAVKEVFPDAIWEHTMQCGKEIDIWVPSIGAGVEYNGNYYHSTACKTDPMYHANKTMLGQKEAKGILHVFTDEAIEPYTNIVRVLRMGGGEFTYEANKRDTIAECSPDMALQFYREWNYIHPSIVSGVCDLHVGLFRRGSLVAVISGIREARKVLRTAMRLYGAPLGAMLDYFQKLVGAHCTVWADFRNPVESNAWVSQAKWQMYHTPIGFCLNPDYSIRYETTSDNTGITEKIYDSGHSIFSL